MANIAIEKKPIVSFGLITDIHYVDNDDRWNFSKTFIRRYRNSLKLVGQACNYWLNKPHKVSFLIQLGDIIDRLCHINQTTDKDLERILEEFRDFPTIYHIWGNHELYNLTRNQLLNSHLCSFDTTDISPNHYGIIPIRSNLKILAIDTYELSLLGIDKDSESYLQALTFLRQYNSNEDVNDKTGLDGYQQRFIELNGGVTIKQINWLKEELIKARDNHENVIIIGHIPIHPTAGDEVALLWNYEDVLNVLWAFHDIVLAYIAGHCHEGGYIHDEKEIHHITLNAIVECQGDTNAFATVHVYEDYLMIEGIGSIKNYQIQMKIK